MEMKPRVWVNPTMQLMFWRFGDEAAQPIMVEGAHALSPPS